MVQKKEFLEPKERQEEIEEFERLYPGLMTNMESDVENLAEEIKLLAKEEKMYAKLIVEMRLVKRNILIEKLLKLTFHMQRIKTED